MQNKRHKKDERTSDHKANVFEASGGRLHPAFYSLGATLGALGGLFEESASYAAERPERPILMTFGDF